MKKRNLYLNTFLLLVFTLFLFYYKVVFIIPFYLVYVFCYLIRYWGNTKIFFLLLFVSFIFNHPDNIEIDSTYKEHIGVVDEVYNTSITVIDNDHRYYLMKVDEDLCKGDVIKYETGYYNDIEKGGFDTFYRSTKSIGYGYANKLEVVEKEENIRNDIYHGLIDENNWYSDITLLMLYGKEEGKAESLSNRIDIMGVSHLFVVSGFHISLLYIMIEKVLGGLFKSKNSITLISFCITTFFLYIVYFPPTGVRAILTLTIARMTTMEKKEALSITGIAFFVINPWVLLSSSMILSFSITLAIYLYRPNEISILDMLSLSLFAFYISLPTVSTWEEHHNIFAPLLSVVLTPIVSFYYILSLLSLPFHWMWGAIDILYKLFFFIIMIFSNLEVLFITPKTTILQQCILTITTVYFVYLMRYNGLTLLSTMFILSLIIFLV